MTQQDNSNNTSNPTASAASTAVFSKLFGVRGLTAVPSLSVEGVLVDKGEYRSTLVIVDVKVSDKPHTLNKNAGLLVPINSIVFTMMQVWHVQGAITSELNRDTKADVWLIIGPEDPNHVLTAAEKMEINDRVERAEKVLAPIFAFHSMTLTPDPNAGNRLGPLGKFMSDGWMELIGKGTPVVDVVNQGKQGGWFHNYKVVPVKGAGDWASDREHADRLLMEAKAQAASKAATQASQAAQTSAVASGQAAGVGGGVGANGGTTNDAEIESLLSGG